MFANGGSKIHLVLALVAVLSLVFQVRDLLVLQGQRECLVERLKKASVAQRAATVFDFERSNNQSERVLESYCRSERCSVTSTPSSFVRR